MDDELSADARELIDAAMALDVPPPVIVEDSWGMVVSRLTNATGAGAQAGGVPEVPAAKPDASEEQHAVPATESTPGDRGLRIPEAGERIGKYVVLDTIGSGAMGVVVRAFDPDLERSVAIKVVRPRQIDPTRTEAARGRLLAEARALARISHPNVLGVYEVGLYDGLIFVAMELVSGVDLERWLRERPRSWREIVDAFEATGRGLAQVHAAGLVHRDVKPANILVGDDGRVRIGDFGIARACFELPAPVLDGQEISTDGFDLDTTALTAEGRVVGTPAYMAPEQHLGASVGPAADQYALCVALYEALWGVRPFRVESRRLLAAKRAGPTLPSSGHGVPRWLGAIVLRGLAPEASARFGSMAELCAALRDDPTIRLRRRIALAAGGLALAATIAIAATVATRPGPCEDLSGALVGVWDPPTRAATAQAFATSDRPWAAEAWAHAAPRLDAYADAWTAMRRDTCEATHVRGEQSAELLDRRMACLEGRRRGLAAATEQLVRGDVAAVDHTFDLLGRLRPLEPCADPIALASAIELPDDAAARAAVDAARTELARARALVDTGRYGEALAQAQAVVATAGAIDHPPLSAESLAFEGEALLRVGEGDQARAALESSLWIAIASGHDEAAIEAATGLVWVAGQYERSVPEARRWGELARASLKHSGLTGPGEHVQLDNALGAALQQAALYDEAQASFERALDRLADEPDSVARAAVLRHNLAKHWIDRGELGRAREILEPTIAELAAVLGRDHPRVVGMRGTLGQVLGASGDRAGAVALFEAEVAGLRLAMDDDALPVAYARSNLGVELARVGRVDEGMAMTEAALAVFEREGDDSAAATCLGNLGDVLLDRGQYDAAEARHGHALRLLEAQYPEGHPDLLFPLVGLGRVRMGQGRFADALASHERALKIVEQSGSPSGHATGLALDGIAQAYRALGRHHDALITWDALVEVMRSAGDVGPDELPAALVGRAGTLCTLGRRDQGLRDAGEAAALARAAKLDALVGLAERACARMP